MGLRRALWVLLVIAGAWLAPPARADEIADRRDVFDTVRTLLWDEQYGELEQLAARYRSEGARTSSGLWRIGLFYYGLELTFADCEGECTRRVDAWVAQYPNSPTARLAYATLRLYWARKEANGAKERLQDVRRYLETHKAIAAQDPNWYEMMLTIASDQAWTRLAFDALLDEARAKAPGYYPNYFAAVAYYTRYGTSGAADVEALATDAVARTEASEATGLYARIYWYAGQVEYGWNLKVNSQVRWDAMKASIDDVLARYPDPWNLNNFAAFACAAKDWPLTGALMGRITGEPDTDVWGYGEAFETCKARSKPTGQ